MHPALAVTNNATVLQFTASGTLELAGSGGADQLGDRVMCHLAFSPSGRHIALASYMSGSVTVLAVRGAGEPLLLRTDQVQHVGGSGVNAARQEAAHAHCVLFSGRSLYVADLGMDKVR